MLNLKLPKNSKSSKNDFCHKTDSHHHSFYQKVSEHVKITYASRIHLSIGRYTRSVTTPALFEKKRYAEPEPISFSTDIVDVQCKNCKQLFKNNR